MTRIVKKFGGTSIGDPDRICAAAAKVSAAHQSGDTVAVVVSAMSGVTSELSGYFGDVAGDSTRTEHGEYADEYDVVVSAGEQITAGLMATALREKGMSARSWLGWQIPIRTDEAHGGAQIVSINAAPLTASLEAGEVPVIAGFQGVTGTGAISTLGLGGSDLTAVEVAHAIGAGRCDIYTDVPGVYTADPNIVTGARKLHELTYREMLGMARHGARVVQAAAVKSAAKNNVAVRILSSFDHQRGTMLVPDGSLSRSGLVCGLTYRARGEHADTVMTISVIGAGSFDGSGLLSVGLSALEKVGVGVIEGAEEDIRLRIDIGVTDLALALRALHSAYELGEG